MKRPSRSTLIGDPAKTLIIVLLPEPVFPKTTVMSLPLFCSNRLCLLCNIAYIRLTHDEFSPSGNESIENVSAPMTLGKAKHTTFIRLDSCCFKTCIDLHM